MRIYTDNPAEVFKALADETRIRIVRLLSSRPLCVCHLVDALAEPQYKISRHLGILKRAGLVIDRRAGTWMHYSIAPDLSPVAMAAVSAVSITCRGKVYDQDDARLAASKSRMPEGMEFEFGKPCCEPGDPVAGRKQQLPESQLHSRSDTPPTTDQRAGSVSPGLCNMRRTT